MRIKLALQGRVREYDVLGGARFELGLEPPAFHRPRGTGFGQFVVREYRPVRYEPAADVFICVGVAEYWL